MNRVLALGFAISLMAGGTMPALAAAPGSDHSRRILYYKSPMGPETSAAPKKDPMGMDYVPVYADEPPPPPAPPPAAGNRRPLYYRSPMGHPETSPVPKKDAMGMDFVPVYDDATQPAPVNKPTIRPSPAAPRRILFYRSPMNAGETSPVPRKDAMGMDFVPVYEDADNSDGTVTISPERVQLLGVRTEAAREESFSRSIRAVGTIAADERRIAVVAPRFEGWIENLIVNATGQEVRRGDPLFTFYSPEAAAAAREYAIARQMPGTLTEAAATRLRYLGLPASDVKATEMMTVRAPIDGTVMEKTALTGARFGAGDTLYRITDLSSVWVLADVFEQDLASVRPGETASIHLAAYPNRALTGTVSFVYPSLNPATRTARVRIELANPDRLLKPDMYATVVIEADRDGPKVVTVPESAVLDDGARRIVLVERGTGRFQPRAISTGRHGDGGVEVTSGLVAGEEVVIAANFMIDSESNLRSALRGFTTPDAEQPK
jgi:Cu(I)/Ag(I) efflux system membrane fusion protein